MILILIDPQLVVPFNRAIMRLLYPSHLRDASYITDVYCDVIYHPDGVQWPLLVLPDTETVPIHIQASGFELSQLLDIFVLNNGITQQEADEIKSGVLGLVGQQVNLSNLIPASWQPYVFTFEQAIQAGYIGNVD